MGHVDTDLHLYVTYSHICPFQIHVVLRLGVFMEKDGVLPAWAAQGGVSKVLISAHLAFWAPH